MQEPQKKSIKKFVGILLHKYEVNKRKSEKDFGSDHAAIIALRDIYPKLSNDFSLVDLVKLMKLCDDNRQTGDDLVDENLKELEEFLGKIYQVLFEEKNGYKMHFFEMKIPPIYSTLSHKIFDENNNIEILCSNTTKFIENIEMLQFFHQSNALNLKNFLIILAMPDFCKFGFNLWKVAIVLYRYTGEINREIIDAICNVNVNVNDNPSLKAYERYLGEEYINDYFKDFIGKEFTTGYQGCNKWDVFLHQFNRLHENNILTTEVLLCVYSNSNKIWSVHQKLEAIVTLNKKYPLKNNDYLLELIKYGKQKAANAYVDAFFYLEKKGISLPLNDGNGMFVKFLLILEENGFDINDPYLLKMMNDNSDYIESLFITIFLIKHNYLLEDITEEIRANSVNKHINNLIFEKVTYSHNICLTLYSRVKYLREYISIEAIEEILQYPQLALNKVMQNGKTAEEILRYSQDSQKGGELQDREGFLGFFHCVRFSDFDSEVLVSSRPSSIIKNYWAIQGKAQLLFLATISKNSIFLNAPAEIVSKIAAYTSNYLDSESSQNVAVCTFFASKKAYLEADWEIELEKYIFDPKFQFMIKSILSNKIDGQISINSESFNLSKQLYYLLEFILNHDENKVIVLRGGYKTKLIKLLNISVDASEKINLSDNEIRQIEHLFCGLTKITTMITAKYLSQQTKDQMNFSVVAEYLPIDKANKTITHPNGGSENATPFWGVPPAGAAVQQQLAKKSTVNEGEEKSIIRCPIS